MTPAEILAQVARRGVEVGLNPAGDGLRLWSDGDPAADLVELLKGIKPELVTHLRRRACDGPLLQSVEAARPPDASDNHWQTTLRGLRAFLASGHGDEALRLGWPPDELFGVPPAWTRVDLCGAALLIGDCEVTEVTPTRIGVRTASGAPQAFYRRPEPDFALVYRERVKLLRRDVSEDEAGARAFEHTVAFCRSHTGLDLETAKQRVLVALKRSGAS